jgi:hypothetical protein
MLKHFPKTSRFKEYKIGEYVGINQIGELILCDKDDDAIGKVVNENANDILIQFRDYEMMELEVCQQPTINITIEKVIVNE